MNMVNVQFQTSVILVLIVKRNKKIMKIPTYRMTAFQYICPKPQRQGKCLTHTGSHLSKDNIAICYIRNGITLATNYSRELLQKEYPGYGKDFVIFPGDDGEDIYGYFTANKLLRTTLFLRSLLGFNVSEALTYTLYTRDLPDGWQVENLEKLPQYFNNTKKTKFITHGWLSRGTADSCILIKDAFLYKYDVNVFIMDWTPVSGEIFYPIPMKMTPEVGEVYATFINNLIDKLNLNPKDVHLIGHSLGAHVSGFAGRQIKSKVSRITGLDPALPGFDLGLVTGNHLKETDADFVDVIHTCVGFLGYRDPIGHVDFYPNGGSPPQPGCNVLKFVEGCSHGRSWQLFANSIKLNQLFAGQKCPGFVSVFSANCSGTPVPIGEPTPPNARGIYYIETTDEEPYLKIPIVNNNDL